VRSGEHALWSINPIGGGGAVFTFALSICHPCLSRFSPRAVLAFALFVSSPVRIAPQQSITVIDPPAWERSTATMLSLNLLVDGGQLAANVDAQPAEWIVPSERDRVPNLPFGYVVSFVRFHERGFAAPASRFMQALCYHYGMELKDQMATREGGVNRSR
jgi:hypothetical protein